MNITNNDAIETNDAIANQLREALMYNEDIKETIRSQERGFLDIFIREGEIATFTYKESEFSSSKLPDGELGDNFLDSWETPLIPMDVYRKFSYLLSATVLYMRPMIYGRLRFQFNFKKGDNGMWKEDFTATYDVTIPFRNGKAIHRVREKC